MAGSSILRAAIYLGSILASSSFAPNRDGGNVARMMEPPAVRRGPLHTLGGSANGEDPAGSFDPAPATSREDDLEKTFQVICAFNDAASSDPDDDDDGTLTPMPTEDDLQSTFQAISAFHDDSCLVSEEEFC